MLSRLATRFAARSPAASRGLCAAPSRTSVHITPEMVIRDWMPNSRRTGAIGMKCGMTTAWSANGTRVPITVIEIQDLQVSKIRVPMKDGVCALQLAGGWQKRKRMTTAEARNFETKGLAYKRYMREFPVTEDALLPVGTTIGAGHFLPGQFVDVQAHTRGHGFQGAVRRFGFKGQSKTHGTTKTERSLGSMGGSAGSMFATRVFKGKRMAGRMGGKRRTVAGLMVWKVVPSLDLVFLKGSVPGAKGNEVRLQDSRTRKQEHFWSTETKPPFPTCLPGDEMYDSEEEFLCIAASDPTRNLRTGRPPSGA